MENTNGGAAVPSPASGSLEDSQIDWSDHDFDSSSDEPDDFTDAENHDEDEGVGDERNTFSSDSSLCSLPAPEDEPRSRIQASANRRQRRQAPDANAHGVTSPQYTLQESVFPVSYKFNQNKAVPAIVSAEDHIESDIQRVGIKSVADVVKYNSSDLLTRAWELCPTSLKSQPFPPFSSIPKFPEVMETQFADVEDIASFMYATGALLAKRQEGPSPVFLRSQLVRAVFRDTKSTEETFVDDGEPFPDAMLNPLWEGHLPAMTTDDLEPVRDVGCLLGGARDVEDSFSPICDLDFSVALLLGNLNDRVSLSSLTAFHGLLDRCFRQGAEASVLRSWGIRRICNSVMESLYQVSKKDCFVDGSDTKWLSAALTFLYKYSVAAGETHFLLSLIRWTMWNPSLSSRLQLGSAATLIQYLGDKVAFRLRLNVPTSSVKDETFSLAHNLQGEYSPTAASVAGFCVLHLGSRRRCVLFTDSRTLDVSLQPPFDVLNRSSSTPGQCCGVFVEPERSKCTAASEAADRSQDPEKEDSQQINVLTREGKVLCIDSRSLLVTEVLVPPVGDVHKKFALYVGGGEFVSPFFARESRRALCPSFDGASFSGMLTPAAWSLAGTSSSLSVQFSLHIPSAAGAEATSMRLVHVTSGDLVWVSVMLTWSPQTGLVTLKFTHGVGATAEASFPASDQWDTWSGVLTCAGGEKAVWNIFCNGRPWEAKYSFGGLVRAAGELSIKLLEGTLKGELLNLGLWYRAKAIEELYSWSKCGPTETNSSHTVFFFPMDEALGCVLHSTVNNFNFRCPEVRWAAPAAALPARTVSKGEKMYWSPSEEFYVTTNFSEYVIVEPDITTWVARDGCVLEQGPSALSPASCPFYCATDGRLYTSLETGVGVRMLGENCAEITDLSRLPSAVQGRSFALGIQQRFDQQKNSTLTATELCLQTLYSSNTSIISNGPSSDGCGRSETRENHTAKGSLQTIGRLLDVAGEAALLFSPGDAEDCMGQDTGPELHQRELLLLALCVTGRYLTSSTRALGHRCPGRVVTRVAVVRDALRALIGSGGARRDALSECAIVFEELHRVILTRCVNYEYPLKLVMESKDSQDIREVLLPESVSRLVTSAIQNGQKKMLMTFLHRLREECQNEASAVIEMRRPSVAASEGMLSAILSMLSQTRSSFWHLVAAALTHSLTNWVVKCFEERFLSEADRTSNRDLLKETAIGVVVFPVVHFMYDMVLDGAITADAIKVLNETRKCLLPYSSITPRGEPEVVVLTETHAVVTPPTLTSPFSSNVDMRYATQLLVHFNDFVAVEEEKCAAAESDVHITFVRNNGQVTVAALRPNSEFSCSDGAIISITTGEGASAEVPQNGVSLTIQATVKQSTIKGDWVRDICSTLSCFLVKLIRSGYAKDAHTAPFHSVSSASFLRGGPSVHLLRDNHLTINDGAIGAAHENLHSELCGLAEEKNCQASAIWQEIYAAKKVTHGQRLEPMMRWLCCALAWHAVDAVSSEVLSLSELLSESIDAAKRKTFLLLEALQQGRETAIVSRARFLLFAVTPRSFGEAELLDQMHTEEPLAGGPAGPSRQLSRAAGVSLGRGSRIHTATFQESRTRTLDFSSGVRGAFQSVRKTMRGAAAVKVFSTASAGEEETVAQRIIYYLINGSEEFDEAAAEANLVKKAKQADFAVDAFKILEELCKGSDHNNELLSSILSMQLERWLEQSQQASVPRGDNGEKSGAAPQQADAGGPGSEPAGLKQHYAAGITGCGFYRELEVQKAFCFFVRSALRAVLSQWSQRNSALPWKESLLMCSVLCHPWNGVDLSLLHPKEIFTFLRQVLTFAHKCRNQESGKVEDDFYAKAGLFNLPHRCLVTPNVFLQVPVDGVRIVDSEVQGLHVENAHVYFNGRTHWRAQGAQTKIGLKTEDTDYFANYGVAGVVSELPDAQYFEVRIDFTLHQDKVNLSMGLTLASIPPLGPPRMAMAIQFDSTGQVCDRDGERFRLSPAWKVGDVIGCGLLTPLNSVFFTLNGEFLGVICNIPPTNSVIPFVEVNGTDTLLRVIANFGEQEPFSFDLASMHCSCRNHYLTPATVGDAAIVTVDYLITMCFERLAWESGAATAMSNREPISRLLEAAASFLSEHTAKLVSILDGEREGKPSTRCSIAVEVARLFHCVGVVIECFRFDCVTPRTHATIVQLCATTISVSKDRWSKARAAECLILIRGLLREDYLVDAMETLRKCVSAEGIVTRLVEMARVSAVAEVEPPLPPPKWVGGSSAVSGKGTYYGATPLPSKGKTIVGFRISRRQHRSQGVGSPLGGCYYLGLSSGQPTIQNMGGLLSRTDVYVLQDTDDQDQVTHILLQQQCIPRNSHRRVYGSDEVVWVELDADRGEITFYRENMILIGLAFANVSQVDDLYPMAFLYNDDATCELLPSPSSPVEPAEHWSDYLRRSIAINALQELHLVPLFAPLITQMSQQAIAQLDSSLDTCLVALAVLGGERSYRFCHHGTYGLVVVRAVADVTGAVIVYQDNDRDKRLFRVSPQGLRPCFVETPLYKIGGLAADSCASLLLEELYKVLYEAYAAAPLMHEEETKRLAIEEECAASFAATTTVDLVGLLTLQEDLTEGPIAMHAGTAARIRSPTDREAAGGKDGSKSVAEHTSPPDYRLPMDNGEGEAPAHMPQFAASDSNSMRSIVPVTIDARHSTAPLHIPNPSCAVTMVEGCSAIRGNIVFERKFTLAISISQNLGSSLMYIGLTTSTDTFPDSPDDVSGWRDAWALCSVDSLATNSVNCCVEPGIIYGETETLYASGDVMLLHVDREEGTLMFSRVRGGERVDFGVLFDDVPGHIAGLRPLVICGADAVVVFSFLDGITFPVRQTYSLNSSNSLARLKDLCSVCGCRHLRGQPWYFSDDSAALCGPCFNSWQFPKKLFWEHNYEMFPTSNGAPLYLLSSNCPEQLIKGSFVEYDENATLLWAEHDSVNVSVGDGACVATKDECFLFSEPLPAYGAVRVDISIGHLAGVNGSPFSGLRGFEPLWRSATRKGRSHCGVERNSAVVSDTVVPHRVRCVASLQILGEQQSSTFSLSKIFIGVTTLSAVPRAMGAAELEALCNSSTVWGMWCGDGDRFEVSDTMVHVLVDSVNQSITLSASLEGLARSRAAAHHPLGSASHLGCEQETRGDDEESLRLFIFSQETCVVTTMEGVISYNESVEPSFAPVAIGLQPVLPPHSTPSVDHFADATVLMDTVERTRAYAETPWTYCQAAQVQGADVECPLFCIGDTISIVQENASDRLQLYVNGLMIAWTTMRRNLESGSVRVLLYLSTRGTTARFVPPVYGKSRIGVVEQIFGSEVCIVRSKSCVRDSRGVARAMRRKNLRFCALRPMDGGLLAAETLKEGDPVAYLGGGFSLTKRGTVGSVSHNTVTVVEDSGDKATLTLVKPLECFVLRNEGKDRCSHDAYPLMTPPSSAITKALDVGKKKFRHQGRGSYNGIMFDCCTTEALDLTGLTVLSRATGRHLVEVYFKKGTHDKFQKDAHAWSRIYEGMIDMVGDHYFIVPLQACSIQSNGTFALYINTSHNCGVGFYSEEDGCSGKVGEEVDSDGTLTVFLGRKSGSSYAFTEISDTPRGFCGSILYKQSRGTPPPLLKDRDANASNARGDALSKGNAPDTAHNSEPLHLFCRPSNSRRVSSVSFTVKVHSVPVRIARLRVPIVQGNVDFERHYGPSHCFVSMFYTRDGASEWRWIWNSRLCLCSDTSEVEIVPHGLCLEAGTYRFMAIVKGAGADDGCDLQNVFLLSPHSGTTAGHSRSNKLITVAHFFGDIDCEASTPALSGELHTMLTGEQLNQNNSASYNGIMFEMRSKEDITLEEIFCVSQTSTEHVRVQLFWREGSMESVAKSSAQWREVATRDLQLVDKQPFSVGPVMLRMRANQCYSIYINTSSSCGVRFFNSSDGHVGDIGDEFEHDGVLTVYVGRKSESSSPFGEIPMEPRAFRGKIVYRTFSLADSHLAQCARFSYLRGFLVTRVLVALMSYVEHDEPTPSKRFSYEKLLQTIRLIAASPLKSLNDINSAENALAALIRSSAARPTDAVHIPLSRSFGLLGAPFVKGDLALLADPQKNASLTSIVRVCSDIVQDGTALVCPINEDEPLHHFKVPVSRLLPVLKCVGCQQPYARKSCLLRVDGCLQSHTPALSEGSRVEDMLVNLINESNPIPDAATLAEARNRAVESIAWVQRNSSGEEEAPTPTVCPDSVEQTASITAKALTADASDAMDADSTAMVEYSIPVSHLLVEEEHAGEGGFVTPFIFLGSLRASASLRLSPSLSGVMIELVTDAPARAPPNALAQFFNVGLMIKSSADTWTSLLETPVAYPMHPGGAAVTTLKKCLDPASLSSLPLRGTLYLRLWFEARAPPPATPAVSARGECWCWEDGSVEMTLAPNNTSYIRGTFSSSQWPSDRPRKSLFSVASKSKRRTVFLELDVSSLPPSSEGGKVQPTVRIRKPFSLLSGEVVTFEVAGSGGFYIWDAANELRCCVTREELQDRGFDSGSFMWKREDRLHFCGTESIYAPAELSSLPQNGQPFMLGIFIGDGEGAAVARLYVPSELRRGADALNSEASATTAGAAAGEGSAVIREAQRPQAQQLFWSSFVTSAIQVTKNGSVATCCGDAGGSVVLGAPLPQTGVSAFVMFLRRRDRRDGELLGSGHFAGVARSRISDMNPHYSAMKLMTSELWAVQDVQDGDSLSTQLPMRPLLQDGSVPVLFCNGTRLLCVVDRTTGTLSIARDGESPRVVFEGIPPTEELAPFVRLDHLTSYAVLLPFSGSPKTAMSTFLPSLGTLLISKPPTQVMLRRYPLFSVAQFFPVVGDILHRLPTQFAGAVEKAWSSTAVRTRLDYRLGKVIEELLEKNVCSVNLLAEKPTSASVALVDGAVRYLSDSSREVELAFPLSGNDSVPRDAVGATTLPEAAEVAYTRLSNAYEVIGFIPRSNMVRLLYTCGEEEEAVQRTAHLFFARDSASNLHVANDVLPHISVMTQRDVVPILNIPDAYAVITDGWYDGVLDLAAISGDCKSQCVVADALLHGLEHWHLHRRVHGHLCPSNIYVRVVHGNVVQCRLWNVAFVSHDSVFAPPDLVSNGLRSVRGDLYACRHLLTAFDAMLASDPQKQRCVQLLASGEKTLSQMLQESEALEESVNALSDGPSMVLHTGTHLRGGAGSYNGIMFDIVAKANMVRVTKLSFTPDTSCTATVSLYTRDGTFMGHENSSRQWKMLLELEMALQDNVEVTLEGFDPFTIPAGSRAGVFLHTTTGNGVLFFSENEGLKRNMGEVEDENNDIGITIGKKSESIQPFLGVQPQRRLLKGSVTYTLLMRSNGLRSSLIYSSEQSTASTKNYGSYIRPVRPLPTTPDAEEVESASQLAAFVLEKAPGAAVDAKDAVDPVLLFSVGKGFFWRSEVAQDGCSPATLGAVGGDAEDRVEEDANEISSVPRDTAKPLMNFLEQHRTEYFASLIRQHAVSGRTFAYPKLRLWRMRTNFSPAVACEVGDEGDTASAHSPRYHSFFVSEPLTLSAVVSLRRKISPLRISVHLVTGPELAEASRQPLSALRPALLKWSSVASFVWIDDEFQCAVVGDHPERAVLPFAKRFSEVPAFIVVAVAAHGIETGVGGSCPVEAFIRPSAACAPEGGSRDFSRDVLAAGRSGLFLSTAALAVDTATSMLAIQSHRSSSRPEWCRSDDAVCDHQDAEGTPSEGGEPILVRPQPHTAVRMRALPVPSPSFHPLHRDPQCCAGENGTNDTDREQHAFASLSYVAGHPFMTLRDMERPKLCLSRRSSCGSARSMGDAGGGDANCAGGPATDLTYVECQEKSRWRNQLPSLRLTSLSTALEISSSGRVATQVTNVPHTQGVVLHPCATAAARHRVVLRLHYASEAKVELSLQHPNIISATHPIEYGAAGFIRDCIYGPEVSEVYVCLDINLQARQVTAVSSYGTVSVSTPKEVLMTAPELQLAFQCHGPGSMVEVVEWKLCSSLVGGDVDAPTLQKVHRHVGIASPLSTNLSLCVGQLTRHSPRGGLIASQDKSAPATNQMEVLMVSYARLLLEKALVSQESARQVVQSSLLTLLSYTPLHRSTDAARLAEEELRAGSLFFIAQCFSQLSAPVILQTPSLVETCLNVLRPLLANDKFRLTLVNELGTSLMLLMLRVATVYTRSVRHAAMECVNMLVNDYRIPLPSHEALVAHLRPLVGMVNALWCQSRVSSAVVQIGVSLVAGLAQRYHRDGVPSKIAAPGTTLQIPYKVVLCVQELLRAVQSDPPKPLPAAFAQEKALRNSFEYQPVLLDPSKGSASRMVGQFTDRRRSAKGMASFRVVLHRSREGSVVVGWNTVAVTGHVDLPSAGCFIDGPTGMVYACSEGRRGSSASAKTVLPGDEIMIVANYKLRNVSVHLVQPGHIFPLYMLDGITPDVGLPYFRADHARDATLVEGSLAPMPGKVSIGYLYQELKRQPSYTLDVEVTPQSYEFYCELNRFAQQVLCVSDAKQLRCPLKKKTSAAGHEVASYTRISTVLGAGAYNDTIPLSPLVPYFRRLAKFDEVAEQICPLVDLRRHTELFSNFCVLKNLWSRTTEEAYQQRVTSIYRNRQGHKMQVTIHTMQAQPTPSMGPFATLKRSVFGQLYFQLHSAPIDTYFTSPIFSVKLAGFGSTDAGGPYREMLSQLASEIMTAHPSGTSQLNPLFVNCGRGGATAIMPNLELVASSQLPLMLEFFGKLLASFFLSSDLLAVELPPLFWKLLLDETPTISDLASLDADIAKLLQPEELMMCTEEELEQRFPGIHELWSAIVRENPEYMLDESLPPETVEAAQLLSRDIVSSEIGRFAEVIRFIQNGFKQVLPLHVLHAYRWENVELLICGTQQLSFEAFRDECDIQLQVGEKAMFLDVLKDMTDEDRTALLRFVTGQSRLPLKSRIKVQHNGTENSLPTSSTCFFTLRLPNYTSASKMKERLLYAARQCKAIDADGQAREHLIIDD